MSSYTKKEDEMWMCIAYILGRVNDSKPKKAKMIVRERAVPLNVFKNQILNQPCCKFLLFINTNLIARK